MQKNLRHQKMFPISVLSFKFTFHIVTVFCHVNCSTSIYDIFLSNTKVLFIVGTYKFNDIYKAIL